MKNEQDLLAGLMAGLKDPTPEAPDSPTARGARRAFDLYGQLLGGGAPRAKPPGPGETWADVYSQMNDPNMSQDNYNKLRMQYFGSKIAPAIPPGYSVEATLRQFLKQTERPSTISMPERMLVRAGIVATAAAKAMVPGIDVAAPDAMLHQIAAREGIDPNIPETAGDWIGQGIALAPLFGVTGPVSAELAQTFFRGEKAIDFAAKVARGGMAFASYDAMRAKDGDRVNAAIRGAEWGALGEAGLAALGYGWNSARNVVKAGITEKVAPEAAEKAAKEAAEAAATGRPPGKASTTGPGDMTHPEPWAMPPSPIEDVLTRPEGADLSPEYLTEQDIQQRRQAAWDQAMGQIRGEEAHPTTLPTQEAAAKIGEANVTEARKIGMTTGPMRENPNKKGLWLTLKNAEGVSQVLSVPRGKESELTGIVEATLAKGGSLDDIEYHPASRSRAAEFMRYFAEQAEAENATVRMNVPKGTVGDHARNLNKMGLLAQVLDDETIQVGPEAGWKKAQRARELNQRLAAEKAGKLIPPPPDDISKKMMRIGELRNQARLAVSPNEVYTEMHHLAGEVSRDFQLTRTQIGQLALDYFTRNAAKENPESAISLLEKYRGRGAPFGVVEGKKAPPGMKDLESRLPGFQMPMPQPTSESYELRLGDRLIGARIRIRPGGTTIIASQPSEKLGFLGLQRGEGPLAERIFPTLESTPVDSLYHESVHDGIAHARLSNVMFKFMKGHEMTPQLGIAAGLLKTYPEYRSMLSDEVANEVFTWAATAIRMGDKEAMAQLVEWDESEEAIQKMVNSVAGRLYENAMHSDTTPIRAFLRRMNDLVRRTQPEVSDALGKGKLYGYNTWFDPEIASWVMRDGEGREVLKKDLNEVFDWMDQADPSSHFPDALHEGYYMGLKGPGVPPGEEPTDATSTLEYPRIPLGWAGFRSLSKPTLDFAAYVQKKLDQYGIPINFYERFGNADTARRTADPIMEKLGADRDGLMTGVTNARLRDYGEVLRTPEEQWSSMQTAHKLDTQDMTRIRMFKEWSDANEREGGVSLIDALKGMHQVRAAGGAKKAYADIPDAIADAIRNGQLGHDDLHVGEVSQWVIRQTVDDRFMSEPLKAIDDLRKIKAKDGTPLFKSIDWQLRNYVNSMRGIPDQGQRILQDWMKGMIEGMNKRIETLNKVLPQAWQVSPIQHPENLWGKYQLLLFTAGLGARPAIFIRDTFQSMHAMAVMGPTAFFRGMQMALTPEGRQMFKDAGAAIEGRNIRQIFGDLSQDIPVAGSAPTTFTKFADLLLAPSRIGHNVGRSIAYLGEYSRALEEIGAFRRGEFAADELANRTSVWFQDPAPRSRLLGMAADPKVPLEEAAKQFGLALNDATQFALRSGTQPALLRTGFGRVLGQYGTWPSNYLEFLRKGGARLLENPRKAVPAVATWAAMNYAAFEGLKSMGIDASKWLFFSPAGYAGSPNEELLRTLMAAPEESATGLEARRKLHEIPWEFVPTGVEIQSILRAINGGEVNVPRLLGFKPLTQQQDEDFDQWLEIETGFKRPPRTP